MRIHPVIMAGGRGTRFWPASRHEKPKQFLTVAGNESLLTRTGKRLLPLCDPSDVWVVTNAQHVELEEKLKNYREAVRSSKEHAPRARTTVMHIDRLLTRWTCIGID